MLQLINKEFQKLTKDQYPAITKKKFRDLNIGDIFTTGLSEGFGSDKGLFSCEIYKKTTKSKAEIIATPGYMNDRRIGGVNPFTAQSNVYVEAN